MRVLLPIAIVMLLPFILYFTNVMTAGYTESKRTLRKSREELQRIVERQGKILHSLDTMAKAEYAVNEHNTFAWNVSDTINNKRKAL